jgi:uncharacterized membrane protein HdeD (DUF308 family)
MRVIASESVRWSIWLSVGLIVLGLLAIAAPFAAGVAVNTLFAWLLVLGGVGHLWFAWHVRLTGHHTWQIVAGLAYLVAGLYMLVHPLVGLLGLTLVLGVYLLLKGISELMLWGRIRRAAGGSWMLLDGVISVILALLIWSHLLSAAVWVVGTLVGIAILFSGISRLMLSLAARRYVELPVV